MSILKIKGLIKYLKFLAIIILVLLLLFFTFNRSILEGNTDASGNTTTTPPDNTDASDIRDASGHLIDASGNYYCYQETLTCNANETLKFSCLDKSIIDSTTGYKNFKICKDDDAVYNTYDEANNSKIDAQCNDISTNKCSKYIAYTCVQDTSYNNEVFSHENNWFTKGEYETKQDNMCSNDSWWSGWWSW